MIRGVGKRDYFASKFDYYSKGGVTVFYGDCRDVVEWLKGYCRFTAIVTDPPYGLKFMGRYWDYSVPGTEFWELFQLVLYPGSPVLSFGGTRTFHRLACAMEDAGLDFCDTICWLHGQGFPKSHNISKSIRGKYGERLDVLQSMLKVKSDSAKWEGWGTALKPAWESILRFQVPTEGTYANNALKYGVAGLNIDGTRVDGAPRMTHRDGNMLATSIYQNREKYDSDAKDIRRDNPTGRWPANLVLSHMEDCKIVGYKTVEGRFLNRCDDGMKPFGKGAGHKYSGEKLPDEQVPIYECNDECPCKLLDEQSGISVSVGGRIGKKKNTNTTHIVADNYAKGDPGFGDKGGASRFFTQIECDDESIPIWECPEDCPCKMLDEQSGISKSVGSGYNFDLSVNDNATHIIKNIKSGVYFNDKGGASRFFTQIKCDDEKPVRFFYCAKSSSKDRGGKYNNHPTCKSLELMKWLCTLVRMPEKNLILDPFAGSGTTLVACQELGIPAIGIEKDRSSFEIASRRIAGV